MKEILRFYAYDKRQSSEMKQVYQFIIYKNKDKTYIVYQNGSRFYMDINDDLQEVFDEILRIGWQIINGDY